MDIWEDMRARRKVSFREKYGIHLMAGFLLSILIMFGFSFIVGLVATIVFLFALFAEAMLYHGKNRWGLLAACAKVLFWAFVCYIAILVIAMFLAGFDVMSSGKLGNILFRLFGSM